MNDLAKQLDILIDRAPKLRAAGFQSLRVGDISMELAPPAVEAPESIKGDDKQARDIDDAVTFGLPEGAELPGFKRPHDL